MLIAIMSVLLVATIAAVWRWTHTREGKAIAERVSYSVFPPKPARFVDIQALPPEPGMPPVIDPDCVTDEELELAELDSLIEKANETERKTVPCPPPEGCLDIDVDLTEYARLEQWAAQSEYGYTDDEQSVSGVRCKLSERPLAPSQRKAVGS